MDSADPKKLQTALSVQGTKIHQHEAQLNTISIGVKDLTQRQEEFQATVTTQVNRLAGQLHQVLTHLGSAPPVTPPVVNPVAGPTMDHVAPTSLRLAPPEKFSGDSGDCRTFLVQCDLHFRYNPAAFVSDQAKVAFMVSHLTGRAAAWATAEWSRNSDVCQSLTEFKNTISRIFDHTSPASEASRMLLQIRQRHRQVVDYAIEFRTVAADSGWNTPALIDAFLNGLSEPIKDHLAPLELPQDLEAIIAMSIRVDNRLRERERERRRAMVHPPSHRGLPPGITPPRSSSLPAATGLVRTAPSQASEEPMQIGGTKISSEERRRRLQEGCCFYCGQLGHQLATCPGKDRAHRP